MRCAFPWKDGVRAWKELPAGFRSLTFTQALVDWNNDDIRPGV